MTQPLPRCLAHLGGKWIAPKPGTDAALAQAICHVWIAEGLYDKKFVGERTNGFDGWKAHVLGGSDGQPKAPEWQEAETSVPARDVRALAREWGTKKTYLGAGSWGVGVGGARRTATGMQWARMMTILAAMQGWGRAGRIPTRCICTIGTGADHAPPVTALANGVMPQSHQGTCDANDANGSLDTQGIHCIASRATTAHHSVCSWNGHGESFQTLRTG